MSTCCGHIILHSALPFIKFCKHLRLNHAHKIFNNTCPSYLKNSFIKINEHHKHNSRSIVLTM